MKKAISIFLAFAMIFALAACTKEAAAPVDPVDYTGTYDIIKIDAGEMSASEDDLKTLRDLGFEAVMMFASDGTGLMSVAGKENDFTYDIEKAIINMGGADSQMEFNEEGQLVVFDDGGTMYLEKRAEE